MVMECIPGPMEVNSKETGKRTRSPAMEYTLGKMAGYTKATGNKIICMDRVITSGLMAENMKDNITMTKRMATVFIRIPMAAATKECGRMESSTVKVYSLVQRAFPGKVNGN